MTTSVPALKFEFEYSAHELANLLPMIDPARFTELREDIRRNGILEPIKLFEGRILDGRNRYKASRECGHSFREADFEEFVGSYADAEAYVFSMNFLRRQLSASQRNEVIRSMILKYPAESNRQIARLSARALSSIKGLTMPAWARHRPAYVVWPSLPHTAGLRDPIPP